MEKSLQEQFDDLLKIKENNLDSFSNQLINILQQTKIKDSFLISKIGIEIRNVDKNRKNLICSEIFINHLLILGIENLRNNKFVMAPFTWCVYNVKIQFYEYAEQTFEEFIKYSEFIVNNCMQLSLEQTNKTPYVVTILKVIKIFRKKQSFSYLQLLNWVDK